MPTTTNRAYPYPSGAVGVPPDVPGDIYKLAAAIDADLGPKTGGSGAVTAFTPTFTNITVGNGTVAGKKWSIAGVLYLKVFLQFGSTTVFTDTSNTWLNLPISNADPTFRHSGNGHAYHLAADSHFNLIVETRTASALMLYAAGADAIDPFVKQGSPFAWAAGDVLSFTASVVTT